MNGGIARLMTAVVLVAAELAATAIMTVAVPAPASAQFLFENPFQNRRPSRGPFDWFGQPQPDEQKSSAAPPPDFSRAPAPKKTDPKADVAVQTSILVLGDSMADWLAYGLELAYGDSPEIGVLRRHRTNSGLIRTEGRNDPRGEYPDWPLAARELVTTQKPKFVLMMIGLNDRRQIRETAQAVQAARSAKPATGDATKESKDPKDPAAGELDVGAAAPEKPADAAKGVAAAEPPPAPGATRSYEFRTDAWSEAYIRRIDETIAALKTSGVPVFWVGLPPLRGQKSSADMSFLNDLYRSRADKAGIIYIDAWDGFVDEDGRFAQYGPDVEGQTRRLRTGDGVYFTQAGARKLAHYVEREIQRWLAARAAPVAVAVPEEPKIEAVAKPGAAPAAPAGRPSRPLAGPTVPLIAAEPSNESDELLGGTARQSVTDATVSKVLVKGDALRPPAGRADDFAWPHRDVAAVGSDPVVVTAELPMTPMLAEKPATAAAPASAAPTTTAAANAAQPAPHAVRRPKPAASYAETQASPYRPDSRPDPRRTPAPFSFPSLFGGGR